MTRDEVVGIIQDTLCTYGKCKKCAASRLIKRNGFLEIDERICVRTPWVRKKPLDGEGGCYLWIPKQGLKDDK